MASGKGSVVSQIEKLALPIAEQLGLEIWNIEFVKEGASWFLRIFIDKEGGISIDDCETFSHAIDGPLDEADPIKQNYYLEVSSPGIERELKKEKHFIALKGQKIKIKLFHPLDDGRRELIGSLTGYEEGVITIDDSEGLVSIKQSDAATVKLYDIQELN